MNRIALTGRIHLLALLQLGAACGASSLAFAADADAQQPAAERSAGLEEIVVTATKRSEPLQDVPISISAISGDDIKARGYTQFGDYLDAVPGVYFQDGGPGVSVVHIRGATEAGVGSTVATYFGETVTSVFTNQGGKPNLRLVDIDRIEVLRGPQGTLFGADALVGVLRIIPNVPDPTKFGVDLETRGFTTAHSNDTSYHVGGTVNIPLIQDRLALRLVAYKDRIGGFIDNIVPAQAPIDYSAVFGAPAGTLVTPAINAFSRKDINDEDTWGARAALRWQLTDRFHVDVNYTAQDVDLHGEPQIRQAAGDYAQSRALDTFQRGRYGERVEVETLVGTYDWNSMSLVSASSWTEMKRGRVYDITFLAQSALGGLPIPWSLDEHSAGKVFTQEVRLQSLGESPLQWTLGGFYLHQDADLGQFVADFSCPTCIPTALFGQDFAFDAPTAKFFDEKQRAIFGEASYEFAHGWTVGAGGRYLKEDLEQLNVAADGFLNNGPSPASPPDNGSVSEFNPSAYLRYKMTPDATFYLQAGRGFRSGTVNGALPSTCDAEAAQVGLGPIADPDTLWNYELGMKTRFGGGRFSVNADIYKEKWKSVQLPVTLVTCGFGGVLNAGDIDGKGIEVEFLAQPTPAWNFNLAFAYNKNEFGTVKAQTGFESGERLSDSPEKNGSVGAQYNFKVGSQWSGFARADLVYVGDVHVRFGPGSFADEDSFSTVNARLGFQRDQLAVELFGDNLSDKRGVIGTTQPQFGSDQFIIRPRELGLEVRYSYR